MDYPVSADENGVNLKPEKMEKEKKNYIIVYSRTRHFWYSKIPKMS